MIKTKNANNNSKTQKNYFINYKFKLILFTIFILFIFKLIVINDPVIIFSTFLFESVIFLFIFGLFFIFRNKVTGVIFYIIFIIHFLISLLNSYYILDSIYRKDSLLFLDFGTILFFIQNILPIKIIIFVFFSFILLLLIPRFIKLKVNLNFLNNKKIFFIIMFVFIIILFLVPFMFKDSFSSPYVNTILTHNLTKKNVDVFDENVLSNFNFEEDFNIMYSQMQYPDLNTTIKYKKILVFVAESLTTYNFELENNNNHLDNFFNKNRSSSIYFENYYTNNQDSRTALLTLVSGIFIPYESYRYVDWGDLYAKKIVSKNNLIDYFNNNNYSTEFMISSIETPYVGKAYNWNKNYNIENETEFEILKKEYLCRHALEYQHGCEDEVMLNKLKSAILNSENLFLLQEFIFGHHVEDITSSKKNRTQYYSDYLNKIQDFLESEDLLDETLIVFVGDHGLKEYNLMRRKEGYNIPLYFVANNLDYQKVYNYYSHIDFADILFSLIINSDISDTNVDNNLSNNVISDFNNVDDQNLNSEIEIINFKKSKLDYVPIWGATNSNMLGYVKSNSFVMYGLTTKPFIESYKNSSEFEMNYMFNLFYNYKKYFDNQE